MTGNRGFFIRMYSLVIKSKDL